MICAVIKKPGRELVEMGDGTMPDREAGDRLHNNQV